MYHIILTFGILLLGFPALAGTIPQNAQQAMTQNHLTISNRGAAFKAYWDKYQQATDEEKLKGLKQEYIAQFAAFYKKHLNMDDKALLGTLKFIGTHQQAFFDNFQYMERHMAPIAATTLNYYRQQNLHLTIYIDPLLQNGGEGIWLGKNQGALLLSVPVLSRLELAPRIFSNSDHTLFNLFIAHELTHVIHQNMLGYDFDGKLQDINDISIADITLFTEGLANYAASEIVGTPLKQAMIFYPEYMPGDGVPSFDELLQKYPAVEKITVKEARDDKEKYREYRAWFSPRGNIDDLMPFKPYPAIGYYLGSMLLQDYARQHQLSVAELMQLDVVDDVPRIIQGYTRRAP
ncbi:hypothetical protein [Shewanella sp. YIC-542]|uniref:hypothetical protein n=1 Tax=Shewanella mytili TaxID=3377111 RepID=UPI00398F8217